VKELGHSRSKNNLQTMLHNVQCIMGKAHC